MSENEKRIIVPSVEEVRSIAVLGFGTMGHTWTTALLMAGLEVHVYEPNVKVRETNRDRVAGYLKKLADKGKLVGSVEDVMARLHLLVDENELATCGTLVLLEVIYENLALKLKTFAHLAQFMPRDIVWWTNTSCLNVATMAEATGSPELFVGTHGMNPVHLMKGVEVVTHPKLDTGVQEFTLGLLRRIGKTPSCTGNVPGFIVNKLLIPWMLEAVRMLERGQATVDDVDDILKSSLGHPQGVFLLTDRVGINTTILVAEELYTATQDPRFVVPRLLYAMRAAGHDGFATGRGFYDWSDPKNPQPIALDKLIELKIGRAEGPGPDSPGC